MSEKTMKNIPKLRFPEFLNDGEWEEKRFSEYIKLYRGSSPRPIKDYLTQSNNGVNWIKIGDTKNAINFKINKVEEKITPKGAEKSRKVETGELILANSMSFGKTYELEINGCIYDGWFVLREYEEYFYKPFLIQFLNSEYMQQQYRKLSAGGIVQNISSEIVNQTILFHTSKEEQEKIADCLSSIDSLISVQSQKVELLQDHKKGLLQNLFPKDGESVPKYRFAEFKNDEDWEEKKLGDLLDYEQPTNYLVNDTNYNDNFKTPVLTAGKTFVLGYTNETSGVFDNPLPVIIFDDFTTATQFVDFSFKAKSSAMKILKAKSDDFNVKVIFELMQNINYQSEEHKRYWISEYQNVTIKIPKPKEQQKIADCLTSIDEEINLQTQKVESLKEHKKALLQQLFPSNEVNK